MGAKVKIFMICFANLVYKKTAISQRQSLLHFCCIVGVLPD